MTRTIAVTGARGFIGAAVVRRLAAMPETRVIALARRRPNEVDSNVHWIESSLQELTATHWEQVNSPAFDAVLHLAAFTPKTGAERDRADAIIEANVVGMQALLASLPRPPRRLVFCSTLDVYSRAAFERTVGEQSPTGPVGLYGLSKLFGEGLAESYARTAGIEHVTLRMGHVYGPGEERYAKLVPETIRRVLAGKAPRIAGDGHDRRDLLYIDDAAEALVRAGAVALDGARTINIARGESYSIRQIVETIAGLAGYAGPIEQLPAPADSYSTVFDTSLMARVLGRWSHVGLHDGLEREIADFRQST
jgi:UDP-glucose 4-epimerase